MLLLGLEFSASPRFILLGRTQRSLLILVLLEHTSLFIDLCGAGHRGGRRRRLRLDRGRTSGKVGGIAAIEEVWRFLRNLWVNEVQGRELQSLPEQVLEH